LIAQSTRKKKEKTRQKNQKRRNIITISNIDLNIYAPSKVFKRENNMFWKREKK